jgi:glutamate-5-semialdehyde dehydrogenase
MTAPMVEITKLTALPEGTRLLLGGDRWIAVPKDVATRFRSGDSVVVVEATAQVLLIPAAERAAVTEAVSRALAAFEVLRGASDQAIATFFEAFACNLEDDRIWSQVRDANEQDVSDARSRGRSTTRLLASESMRADMAHGLRGWALAPSRRGQVLERIERPGMSTELVGAALGVVGFVFEGRPNVLADATGVLRGGNAVVFRIGRDALSTASALMRLALEPALASAGLPQGAIELLGSPEHAAGHALFCDQRLSLAVARGSGPAVATLGSLARQAGIPVSLHGTGGAWIVAAESVTRAALEAAVFDSLDRKVCNTLNVLCLPRSRAEELVPLALSACERAGARLGQPYKLHVVESDRGCVPAALFSERITVQRAEGPRDEARAEPLPEAELGREWEWEQTPELTLKIVDGVPHAVALFNRYSPQFIASLLSADPAEHERFYQSVNAPFVGDAGTRWVDGQKALDKPELGLSNWQWGRLFGRGGILSGDSVYTVRTRARRRP